MCKQKSFSKDFILVVIGQIISLFGNAILRYALPVYLLNMTQSAALFGMVSAISFIPMIILSPIGGIIADRVNKRNIMVILDFSTAALTLLFTIFLGKINLIALILVTLIILYGIQGAYQPAVQASIPVLISTDKLMAGNAIINLVSSLSALIGPSIGGTIMGAIGIMPILIISIICFIISAVMEIFIVIPYEKRNANGNMFAIALNDMKESIIFIKEEQPIIAKVSILIAIINMFFSSLITIGLPVVITQRLGFEQNLGNQLLGYCQGALSAGGLLGGLLAGTLSKKIKTENSYLLLIYGSLLLVPIGSSILLGLPSMITYGVMVVCCFLIMILCSIFTIGMTAFVQRITPSSLIGKIMSFVMCLCLCAQPIGQVIYGSLFELMGNESYVLFFGAAIVSSLVSLLSKSSIKNIPSQVEEI